MYPTLTKYAGPVKANNLRNQPPALVETLP
jgi:hypothetical protein